jgi:predicted RNA-binding protein with PIN domain
LIVDGHSVVFAWPELAKLHRRRSSLAREELIKRLRSYQDWTGLRVVVVFDGKGSTVGSSANPGDVQISTRHAGKRQTRLWNGSLANMPRNSTSPSRLPIS